MSGPWFTLSAVADGLVIRWYIVDEAKLAGPAIPQGKIAKGKVRFGPLKSHQRMPDTATINPLSDTIGARVAMVCYCIAAMRH